jgi:GT2 family glycosyltransferase
VSYDIVVVLNFHGWTDTDRCVRSLVQGSPEATVVVVDNESTVPFPPAGAGRHWESVTVLRNTENLGFAGGMNTGLRWALEREPDTVTVLNNDTVVREGMIEGLARVARDGVAVSPEVRYLGTPDAVWFAGGSIDRRTNLALHDFGEDLQSVRPNGRRGTETLAGCCVTASAETWHRVGLFDERYFLIFEDSDWSARATALGIPLEVDTTVIIEHAVSASFYGGESFLGLYYYVRNAMLFGRERCGGGLSARILFLRLHVLPQIMGPVRERRWRLTCRRALVVLCALRDDATRRYGPAPPWLADRAGRWFKEPS